MGCPHSSSSAPRGDEGSASRGLDRREFVKAALAIGGASAFSACVDRQGLPEVSRGDPVSVPRRQFAWNEYIPRDSHGNTVLPNHQLILFFRYLGDSPTGDERDQIAGFLRSIERA
jgi:hypothetical protein